ncbi:MAG: ferredoxin [Motilibacteraceae bacterium]
MSKVVRTVTRRVRVDWIACQGRGLCVELLPERIRLDEWGYPVLDDAGIGEALLQHARAAARACPTRALRLTEEQGR